MHFLIFPLIIGVGLTAFIWGLRARSTRSQGRKLTVTHIRRAPPPDHIRDPIPAGMARVRDANGTRLVPLKREKRRNPFR